MDNAQKETVQANEQSVLQDPEMEMNCVDLSKVLGAQLISFQGPSGPIHVVCSSVCIDSRQVVPGALFVALVGTVQDGHRYVGSAFESGARAAMVARSRWEDPASDLVHQAREAQGLLLVVEDTLRGLQQAAAYYLARFPGLLRIGITGSSGKTTTKEIVAAILGQEQSVVMNQGNLNSETGLPLSVFKVRPYHQVGIFEMGMNRAGEIGELAQVLKPHIALITNIGSAHIGILGSKQAIAQEKKGIFSAFSGTERALIPEEDPYRNFLAEGIKGTICFYGPQSFRALADLHDRGLEGIDLRWDNKPVHCQLIGKHNIRNLLAALAIAREVPVSTKAIWEGLESVQPLFGRSEILRGPVTVIRDCYNANPESMQEAIGFCDSLDWQGRRIYVIGSMLELGSVSPEAHAGIGRALAASKADGIYFLGSENQGAVAALEQALKGTGQGKAGRVGFYYTDSLSCLSQVLADQIQPGDLVLLKGSRACGLEGLTEVVMGAHEARTEGGV
ncbi:MAG: UDP-N-acetylmuramoyl-tripeptide--D-alanyl-D-alanine ligase [Treponema sp.]|jgi:UDP-N-acetylmuramoyl-tripeptide--D-alanyl-D-alanine ligase|nr:UDP-N-acetylmuramoyl-tripeptide--D-alanyl-D-alanine ligase [Treponema sp.]